MLRERDSNLKLSLVALARKQRVIPIHFVPATTHNVEASRAFIVLGNTARDAVPELIRAYRANISSESKSAIADSIGWIGPAAEPAVPSLLPAASDPDLRVRASALWALGEIHARPKVCLPVLIGALSDSNGWVRLSAAHALGGFGADAQAAIPALSELTNSPQISGVFNASKAQECSEARKALQKILGREDAPPGEITFQFQDPFPGLLPFPSTR
jgi:HEAT repeat protein